MEDRGATGEARTAGEALWAALRDMAYQPGTEPWRRGRWRLGLGRAMEAERRAPGTGTAPPEATLAVREHLGDALGRAAHTGSCDAATLGLARAAGVLGDLARLAGPGGATGMLPHLGAWAGAGAGASREQLLTALRDADPAWAPFWAASLRRDRQGFWGRDGHEATAWGRLYACAREDPGTLRALLGDRGLGHRAPRDEAIADAAAQALGREERMALLTRHAGGLSAHNALAWALARGLRPRDLRHLALRRAAAASASRPRHDQPLTWGALAGAGPGEEGTGTGGATASSRLRCARWLAGRRCPAWRPALDLILPESPLPAPALPVPGKDLPPAAAAVLRTLADGARGRGRMAAARHLLELGDGADEERIEGLLADAGDGRGAEARVRLAAGHADGPLGRAAARGATRGALQAAAADPEEGARGLILALELLGHAFEGGPGPAAASLLAGPAGVRAARALLRHAPELASAEALARAGLLPGVRATPGGLLAGGMALRRRADGALIRDTRGARTPGGAGEDDRAGEGDGGTAEGTLRAAEGALRRAWRAALDGRN